MPKKGYKTLTMYEASYETFKHLWSKKKQEYGKKGIKSLSAFIAYQLNEMMENPRFEHFNIDDEGVRILDHALATATSPKGRIIDVYFKPTYAFCDYDQKKDCEHVKFALGLSEVQQILKRKGWKLPDVS